MSNNNMLRLLALLSKDAFAVEPNFAEEMLKIAQSGGDMPPTDNTIDAVEYKTFKNVASIFVDGAMYKKNISNICFSVASYDQIKAYIKKANADNNISDIIIKVDTPGGSVAGVESLREVIEKSTKDIHIVAENCMASAGMWAFSAGKKIYANNTTYLGSLGVIVSIKENSNDKTTYKLASKNADNKVCDIEDPNCKERVQKQIDDLESMFIGTIASRFNKAEEDVINDFDRGGVIFAETAHKLGYIDDIMSYEEVLNNLVDNSMATMPPDGKIVNQNNTKEATMPKDLETANATIADLQGKLGGKDEKIAELEAKVKELEAKQNEMVALATVEKVINMDSFSKVDAKTVLEAIKAKDETVAENIMLKAMVGSDDAQALSGGQKPKENDEESKYNRYEV